MKLYACVPCYDEFGTRYLVFVKPFRRVEGTARVVTAGMDEDDEDVTRDINEMIGAIYAQGEFWVGATRSGEGE